METPKVAPKIDPKIDPKNNDNWKQYLSPVPKGGCPDGTILSMVFIEAGATAISEALSSAEITSALELAVMKAEIELKIQKVPADYLMK